MSFYAPVVRELIAAGVTGDALVTALERIEAAATPIRTKAAERTARWRERHRTSQNVTSDVKKEIPQTPLEKIQTISTGAREDVSRGTRLPADFTPIPTILELARNRGLSDADFADELEKFRDWANSATGTTSRKRDWQGAFRNWIKRAIDDRKRWSKTNGSNPQTNSSRSRPQRNSIHDSIAVVRAALVQRIADERGEGAGGTGPGNPDAENLSRFRQDYSTHHGRSERKAG